jgi:thiamine-phosphate pyrophosphorylase
MKLCYVTDRKALAGSAAEQIRALLDEIEKVALAGVEWIQIREKDLSGRELAALVSEAVRRVPDSSRVLVNDRLDVTLVVGAGGVHLSEHSIPVEEAKRFVQEKNLADDFLLGVSTHSLEAARAAEEAGANYVIFGPVFATPSKAPFGPPQGVEHLGKVCASVSIPVIAIGGITAQNARKCVMAGASGVAAIRMFQDAANIAAVLRELREPSG